MAAAAATTLVGLALPGSDVEPLWVVWLVVGIGVAWGALLLLGPPWAQAPMTAVHVSTILAIGAGAVLGPVTGGTDSPTLDYLWFVVVYAAFFLHPAPGDRLLAGARRSSTRCRWSTTGTPPTATSRAS